MATITSFDKPAMVKDSLLNCLRRLANAGKADESHLKVMQKNLEAIIDVLTSVTFTASRDFQP